MLVKEADFSDGAAFEEGVLLVNYGGRVGEDDGNGIETNLVPIETSAGYVAASGPDDTFLFLAINGAVGGAEFGRDARFYLDEDQCAIVASHDVDFGVSWIRAVISGDNSEAGASKVAVREIFTAAAESGIGR